MLLGGRCEKIRKSAIVISGNCQLMLRQRM